MYQVTLHASAVDFLAAAEQALSRNELENNLILGVPLRVRDGGYEEMITGAVAEVLLGLRRDPVYGVSLTLGMGGVTAEVLADTVTLVLPVTEAQVLEAARGLRLWPLLDGYRGRPKADMGAVAAMAVRLGALMLADESLEEIEINPVMVREQGAVAVDALVSRV